MNSRTDTGQIRIAVAGHTNVGKTSLIQTLIKAVNGDIEDRANVTEHAELITYPTLGITFIDTPGFQNAGAYSLREKMRKLGNDVRAAMGLEIPDDIETRYDERAAAAVRESDVTLYVASLSDGTPDGGHGAEIALTRAAQPRVVGVINQYRQSYLNDPKKTAKRVQRWQELLASRGVDQVVVFDCHWDSPRKADSLYDAITTILDGAKQEVLASALKRSRLQRAELHQKACYLIATCIDEARKLTVTDDSEEREYDDAKTRSEATKNLRTKIEVIVQRFVETVAEQYLMAANVPALSDKDVAFKVATSKSIKERLGNMASSATVAGSIAAGIGAAIGTAFVPGPGTAVGAAIGGGIGALGGGIAGAAADTNTHVVCKASETDLQLVFEFCVASVWGIWFQGFAKSNRVSEGTIDELRLLIRQSSPHAGLEQSWSAAGREMLAMHASRVLDALAELPLPRK
jgi:GTPase SAR1 family protein